MVPSDRLNDKPMTDAEFKKIIKGHEKLIEAIGRL